MLLLETMNTWDEAECAIDGALLGAPDLPIIVSMQGAFLTIKEPRHPQTHKAKVIAKKLLAKKQASKAKIVAFGFNCVPPAVIVECLKDLQRA